MQVADEELVEVVVGDLHGGDALADPNPMSKMNLSPLPSSTIQQAAACLGRAFGIPVPQAMMRISSAPMSSEPG